MQKGLTILLMLAFVTPACAPFAVASRPPATQNAGCSKLIPGKWKEGVEAPPLPDGNVVGDWIAFGDAALGKLDVANDRIVSAVEIFTRCEERDAEAIRRAKRGFFGRIFG